MATGDVETAPPMEGPERERETQQERSGAGEGEDDVQKMSARHYRRHRRSHSRSRSRSRSRSEERRRRRRYRSDEDKDERRDRDQDRDRYRDRNSERRHERERDREREGQNDKARAEGTEKPRSTAPAAALSSKEIMAKFRGGVYLPPHRLAEIARGLDDKNSEEYQRLSWDALKKSVNGHINKVNVSNIKNIVVELFRENLVRGKGLFVRSMMKAQMASPGFTHVYAGLASIVNTKMPEIGELLLKRVIAQFRRAYRRNDKPVCMAVTKYIAHLANQQVAHEILALQLLTLLLEKPTDDSVEVAVFFTKECGQYLAQVSAQGLHAIFERFRGILHEGEIDKRTQYMIEGLFADRKKEFSEFPARLPELDLVDEENQITHEIGLDDQFGLEEGLDLFHVDPEFMENEAKYDIIRKEILGEESDEEEASEKESGGEDSEEEEGEGEEAVPDGQQAGGGMEIIDQTETDVVNLRRTIYLTIMSSLDFEECAHKLLKVKIPPGYEVEICTMLVECCSQERTSQRFYGLLGQRFCMLNQQYQDLFAETFQRQYTTIHRLETNKLRNVAKFFAHLLHSDALSWTCLAGIKLNEEDTTSSSRIYIKILFQELAEYMGLKKLNERLKDPLLREHFDGLFPRDNPRNTRFAINFFTSIGLGALTDELRDFLKNAPKLIMAQKQPVEESSSEESSSSESDSGSSDESGGDSDSESSSESDRDRRNKRRRR